MNAYEKARAEILQMLQQFQGTFALGFDVGQAVRTLITEIEFEQNDN
jgi:hypothetical protein